MKHFAILLSVVMAGCAAKPPPRQSAYFEQKERERQARLEEEKERTKKWNAEADRINQMSERRKKEDTATLPEFRENAYRCTAQKIVVLNSPDVAPVDVADLSFEGCRVLWFRYVRARFPDVPFDDVPRLVETQKQTLRSTLVESVITLRSARRPPTPAEPTVKSIPETSI